MTRVLVVHGPPGTGKTHRVSEVFEQSVKTYGPEHVAAVTYTRAAAFELQARAARVLGLRTLNRHDLRLALPWVGTIHALCYRLLGHPTLAKPAQLLDFFKGEGLSSGMPLPEATDPEEADGYIWQLARDDFEYFLMQYARARHLLDPSLMSRVPSRGSRRSSGLYEDMQPLVERYNAWKAKAFLRDFEDLLEQAPLSLPGVRVLLIDEAQDNSPLMMRVVRAWSEGTELTVYAGDPFQAIYQFCGAQPDLLMDLPRSGLVRLEVSRRLPADSAEYAHRILGAADWTPEEADWLGTWHGEGETTAVDSEFFLARTRTQVYAVRDWLEERGVPYRLLRGTGPLDMLTGRSFRLLFDLQRGSLYPRDSLRILAKALNARQLPPGVHANLTKLSGEYLIGETAAQDLLKEPLGDVMSRLQYAEYFYRILAEAGAEGLLQTPKLAVGTIHCSPPGEPILTSNRGYIPIEELSQDDRLQSYAYQRPLGRKAGYEFIRTEREYAGPVITITTATSRTRVTPNHKVMAYYRPDAERLFLVYLMRRGAWWRLGQTSMRRVSGEHAWGLTRRMGNEGADDAWVLAVFPTREQAIYEEARLATVYGIPAKGFSYRAGRGSGVLTPAEWGRIQSLAAPVIRERVNDLLLHQELHLELPFYSRGTRELRSDRRMFEVYAANLWPQLLDVCTLDEGQLVRRPFEVDRNFYRGPVYDLEVAPHHTYFSGGLLVHNSAKGLEADRVRVVTSWGTLPYRALGSVDGRREEACVAYVAATRHRNQLELVDLSSAEGYPYPWP